jgi:hypothetical protein
MNFQGVGKMISCIVVDDQQFMKSFNKSNIEVMFYGENFEMDEHRSGMILIFIHEVERLKIWQAVLDLEVDQIPVGFGFGMEKEEAREKALYRLKMTSNINIH